MSNPLLCFEGLPPFKSIQPEHVIPAIEQRIRDCKSCIERLVQQEDGFTWDNLVAPLEEIHDRLNKTWSPVSHMNAVINSAALRQAHDDCLPLLVEYHTYMRQHRLLFDAFVSLSKSDDFQCLSQAQRKEIEHTLRDFRLSGIELTEEKRQRFAQIETRLTELASVFSNQLMDATQNWTKHILPKEEDLLAGLPKMVKELAKQAAETKNKPGWLFTLDVSSYLPVMMYADHAPLREEMYRAFTTKASDQGPDAGKFDNSLIIDEILSLRHEQALLLGYTNYAQLSLATKMAHSTDEVLHFLTDLAQKAWVQANKDKEILTQFATEQFQVQQLQAWDIAYYKEKLKQARYAISDEVLRAYFPESQVISGLFAVVERVFGLCVRERYGVETWHEDVRFFDIFDQQGQLRGSFYLDLYARMNKRGGAWMDECINRRYRCDGSLQYPVAYLTCNFSRGVQGQEACFTHDEVITLFHEFGHGLHHLLTKVDVAGVAGINGVPWDAVELPSQFLENWCWQPQALALMTKHYETGESLPDSLLQKMLQARNFQAAIQLLRQLEFSLFDFRLHAEQKPRQGQEIQALLDEIRTQCNVFEVPDFNRFQHSFSHIFAGGYAAGYYSYKWAEVLSADAFACFEEEGIFNADTGRRFLKNILEQGGSQHPMKLFKAFRGREPRVDALLRYMGVTNN